jgi:flagellar secretion chaperone FliS
MTASTRAANLAAYQMVATHGGVAAADPHRLILMLLDGAMSRIAQARGSIDRGASADRITHLNRALAIIGELRASLDPAGGAIASNLDNLYEFMSRQVLLAHVDPRVEILDGVSSLLSEIRSAWILIPQDARTRPAEIR